MGAEGKICSGAVDIWNQYDEGLNHASATRSWSLNEPESRWAVVKASVPSSNTMLGVLLALAIFVTFCDAQCTFFPFEIIDGYQPRGCRDSKGIMHEFDTQWESDCMHCSCEVNIGQVCCSMVMRPTVYDKNECLEIFVRHACIYYTVKRSDPSILCEVSQYTG
ncbi:beta-microseminoprotein-like [Phascolarctos cinereus]